MSIGLDCAEGSPESHRFNKKVVHAFVFLQGINGIVIDASFIATAYCRPPDPEPHKLRDTGHVAG